MASTRTNKNGLGIATALCGLLVMLTAAPVFAGHEDGLRRHDKRGEYACGLDGCNDRHVRPGICHAKREYDRGHALGYREGKDRGYRDAVWCNPFCDGIPRRLRRYSRFFAAGYVDAYPVAYRKSFYKYQTPPWRRGIGRGNGRGNGRGKGLGNGRGKGLGNGRGKGCGNGPGDGHSRLGPGSWRFLGERWGR